mmetsp:Transcript_83520/g.145178  ORF Transcript_83520/g.145178 Transcript_83520/m.145178 type:complete len:232 (+) Transcript_83520:1234-1929(+)
MRILLVVRMCPQWLPHPQRCTVLQKVCLICSAVLRPLVMARSTWLVVGQTHPLAFTRGAGWLRGRNQRRQSCLHALRALGCQMATFQSRNLLNSLHHSAPHMDIITHPPTLLRAVMRRRLLCLSRRTVDRQPAQAPPSTPASNSGRRAVLLYSMSIMEAPRAMAETTADGSGAIGELLTLTTCALEPNTSWTRASLIQSAWLLTGALRVATRPSVLLPSKMYSQQVARCME